MEKYQQPFLSFFLLQASLSLCLQYSLILPTLCQVPHQLSIRSDAGGGDDRHHAYIVHVEKPEHMVFAGAEEREEWHRSFLPSVTLDSCGPRLIYSYEKVISGFAAWLTPVELEAMRRMEGVLDVEPAEAPVEPRTTRSQHFLGLDSPGGTWELTNEGEGMIIGVVDSGLDPTHPSFDDAGMPEPPVPWRAHTCDFRNQTYRCNKKVIGAMIFNAFNVQSRVDDLHGTLVANCAAGRPVAGASYLGHASGTSAGAAPRAHIAFYLAVGHPDVLKAYDQAIMDGVDVLSVSQGLSRSEHFHSDNYAIGALSAVEAGIFVSVAAGNAGPGRGSILDNPPWTLSVGATTIDRAITASIWLGNGNRVHGESLLDPGRRFPTQPFDVVYPTNGRCAALGCAVKGKVVLCLGSKVESRWNGHLACAAWVACAAAVVLMNQETDGYCTGSTLCLDYTVGDCDIPAVQVTYQESRRILEYYHNASKPSMVIQFGGTSVGVRPSPTVASFSSRGPSSINNGVLKPDILGPGANILSSVPSSSPYHPFMMRSGTSLACPHLSGIAAMLKKNHSNWTPAAIKSAIMTTASLSDNTHNPITDETGGRADLFATGAGMVNASGALDPGLVYDVLDPNEYTRYVCGLGYRDSQVKKVLRRTVDCAAEGSISGEELNYPSFSISLGWTPKTVNRTLTSVQKQPSSYSVSVDTIPRVLVDVHPAQLLFGGEGDNRTFSVTFTPTTPRGVAGTTVDGQLRWTSTTSYHVVRSPIAVTFE